MHSIMFRTILRCGRYPQFLDVHRREKTQWFGAAEAASTGCITSLFVEVIYIASMAETTGHSGQNNLDRSSGEKLILH